MATWSSGEDGGGWWEGWIQAAKEKSAVALEQMKRDLGEFGSTIQRDTSSIVATSAGVIKDSMQIEPNESSTTSRVKQGFSNLLSGLSESLAPKDYQREEPQHVSTKSSQHIFDRAKIYRLRFDEVTNPICKCRNVFVVTKAFRHYARLHSMQIDAGTYCSDPEGPPGVYEDWLQTFDSEKYKGDISDLLVANTDVRAIYTKLVPAVVSNNDFWGRYFYKVHQLNQDEARRAALKERADMTSSQTFDEEELRWDDDEEDASDSLHSHEGKNTPMKVQGRIPTPLSGVACAEEQRHEELRHDCEDGQSMMTEATHTQQPQEASTLHQGHRQESTEEEVKTKLLADDIVALPRATPDRDCNTVVSELQEETRDRQQDSSVKTMQLGGDETQVVAPSCEDDEIEQPAQCEDHTLGQATKDKAVDIGTLHIATEEVPCDEPNVKKISPSGSEASNKDSSLSDDWEKDFDDIDVTEEDFVAAALKTKTQLTEGNDDDDLDDWESWE